MKLPLYLLAALAVLGAFDTLYYHEWRARLPTLGPLARSELRLHACRDFVYAVLFATLPWLSWQGWTIVILAALFFIEIVLTLWDFVVEDWVRKPLGGVYPGERVMHGIMGIVYGAMLAYLAPTLKIWWNRPSGLIADDHQLIREGLKAILEQDGFKIVGEAMDGQEAVGRALELEPDVAVLDLTMPFKNGIEAAREIVQGTTKTRTILLTVHKGDHYVREALRAGVRGYVLKSRSSTDLIQAIYEVSRGMVYVSGGISLELSREVSD